MTAVSIGRKADLRSGRGGGRGGAVLPSEAGEGQVKGCRWRYTGPRRHVADGGGSRSAMGGLRSKRFEEMCMRGGVRLQQATANG